VQHQYSKKLETNLNIEAPHICKRNQNLYEGNYIAIIKDTNMYRQSNAIPSNILQTSQQVLKSF
jgi:hypothetical protein